MFISLIIYILRNFWCMNCIFLTIEIIPGEWYGRKILKKISDVPFSENYRSIYLSSNLLYQGWQSPLFGHIFRRTESRFSHFQPTSGERYERKILKKIPVVLLSKTCHLSYYMSKSVAWNSQNRVLYNFKRVKLFFILNLTVGAEYERKILEKISDVSLDSIYRWCEFQNFSSKTSTMKK